MNRTASGAWPGTGARLAGAALWLLPHALMGQAADTSVTTPPAYHAGGSVFDRDATGSLSRQAASFVYDFGAFGWPNGWSPYGISPQWVALEFDGIPYDDPVTGRPRYDLLPTALLARPEIGAAEKASPVQVDARLRSFNAAEPLTELHYQTGDHGLQRATVIHVQRRGAVEGLFAYSGAAARGEFPGSRLRRMRRLLLEARYHRPGWSAQATYVHNQRTLGAHAGVLGANVYNRLVADVRLADAVRRTVRNDLRLAIRASPLGPPLEAAATLTTHRLRFTNPAKDTVQATVYRLASRLRQSVAAGPHSARLDLEAWFGHATRVHLTARDSLSWGRFGVVARAGLHAFGRRRLVAGAVQLSYDAGRVKAMAEAWRSGQAEPWLVTRGWGDYLAPYDGASAGRIHQVRLGLEAQAGALDAKVFGFAQQQSAMLDFYAAGPDSIAMRAGAGATRHTGVGGRTGIRRRALRGLYAEFQPTLLGSAQALPDFFLQARLGARYHLFSNDLGLDVSVRGRYWTSMRGRTLHAPTGLLVRGREDVPASGTVDVHLEALVRGATLLVAYENLLSGTPILDGNLLVPTYPLPAQFLRLGVYWPIRN